MGAPFPLTALSAGAHRLSLYVLRPASAPSSLLPPVRIPLFPIIPQP